ncbi:hypothetical protein LAT59_01315 [Candidatus Gracilibacteria bacterium]|nr:hypothetical protein [Candidatus Gracilibacteria bacterium]
MISIKIDDTIIDIIQKIELSESKDIFLDIPVGHPLLHNYISLKMLRNKVPKAHRLVIITSDRLSRKIGQSLGIEYSLIRNKEVIQDASQSNILQKNFTIWEYFWYQLKYYKNEIFDIFEQNKNVAKLKSNTKKINEKVPFHFALGLFFVSIIIFTFIYYLAISKTFITIKPELSVRKEVLNFTLTEEQSGSILGDNRNVQVERITKVIEMREEFGTSIKEAKDNQTAVGSIRIYNYTTDSISLVPNTRFITEEGIVYDIDSWIQIPAGLADNFSETEPGVKEVIVSARTQDIHGNISGIRGNISSGTKLTLPGLGEQSQELIYAESIEDFSGGSEEFISIVAQSDIDIAKRILTERLRNEVLLQLRYDILENNILGGVQKSLLTLPNTLDYSTPQISVVDNLKAGDAAESFELQGIMELRGFVFNEGDIIQRLRHRINEKQLQGIEKILQVDQSSLKAIELLSRQERPFRLKASFEIEVLSEHDFLHDNNTYIERLSERIRGVDKHEAERILLNDVFISYVDIQNRPFFKKNISQLPSNIFFRIQSNER